MSLFRRRGASLDLMRRKVARFRGLLEHNNRVLDLLADAEEKLGGDFLFDSQYLRRLAQEQADHVGAIIRDLRFLTGDRHSDLLHVFDLARARIDDLLASRPSAPRAPDVIPLDDAGLHSADVSGEKMARLGMIQRRLGCRVPDGFVITTSACAKVFERAAMAEHIRAAEDLSDGETMEPAVMATRLRGVVEGASVPRGLRRAIRRAARGMPRREGQKLWFAVRSSAQGEDGDLSFAGLHDSVLGVSSKDLPRAYLQVVGSLFNARAIAYRRRHDEPLTGALMAVGCMRLVDAVASGVVYTLDPAAPDASTLIVTAAPGLGKTVVEGSDAVDQFAISREDPGRILRRQVSHKGRMYLPDALRGVQKVSIPKCLRDEPTVDDDFLRELATTALRIERLFKAAQDIEWALDEQGHLVVLQSRTLQIPAAARDVQRRLRAVLPRHTVLLESCGTVACRGIGSGPVVLVSGQSIPEDLPPDAVLVARQSSPLLAELLPRASALVTEIGAPTSHLATIARELHVPTIVEAGDVTSRLTPGRVVTVDAEENRIYDGRVEELLTYQLLNESRYLDIREFRTLRRMLKLMAPLRLRNPRAKSFTARGCETYHDIIRFAHEKAVEELARIHPAGVGRRRQRHCRTVALDIPLDLVVIDLEGGALLRGESDACEIHELGSPPLRALLEGLTAPGAWSVEPTDMDLGSFLSSITSRLAVDAVVGETPPRNLAIFSEQYLNLSVHLGYHFSQVDTYVSDVRNDNYLYFRFSGGMTSATRLGRRARLIGTILERQDFLVEILGDFVVARLKKVERAVMLNRLKMLGALIGYTRQLDVKMTSEAAVGRGVEEFMWPIYNGWDFRRFAREDFVNGPTRVVVIDDEPIVCKRLKEYLEGKGLLVEAFTRSSEAIARMEEQPFHVAVTDLKMEHPDGMELLRYLRDKQPATQGILITAFGMFERVRKAEALGAFSVIDKPFQMAELLKIVKKAAKKAVKTARKRAT